MRVDEHIRKEHDGQPVAVQDADLVGDHPLHRQQHAAEHHAHEDAGAHVFEVNTLNQLAQFVEQM